MKGPNTGLPSPSQPIIEESVEGNVNAESDPSFAAFLEVMASSTLELRASKINENLSKDLTTYLKEGLSEASQQTSGKGEASGSHPTYIEYASKWLFENVHCPYPSAEVRADIAKRYKCPRKDVDSWFVDARRRIGWNALRKTHFDNKRANIVEAATQFFVKPNPTKPLCSALESQFILLQGKAERLYSKHYSESVLAKKLDEAIDTNRTSKRQRQEARSTRSPSFEKRRDASLLYPSPEHSPVSTLPTALPAPLESDAGLKAPSRPSSKRRASSTAISEGDQLKIPPQKRARLSSTSGEPPSFGLPSPAASDAALAPGSPSPAPALEDLPTPSHTLHYPQDSPLPVTLPSSSKRKRSSDDGKIPATSPKRQHLTCASVDAALSPPLPDNWLPNLLGKDNTFFADMPPPVSTAALDPSQELSVELATFDHSLLDVTGSDTSAPFQSVYPPSHGAVPYDDSWLFPEGLSGVDGGQIGDCLNNFQRDTTHSTTDVSHQPQDVGGFIPLESLKNFQWPDGSGISSTLLADNVSFDHAYATFSVPTSPSVDPPVAGSSSSPRLTSAADIEAKQQEFLRVQAKYLSLYAELTALQ